MLKLKNNLTLEEQIILDIAKNAYNSDYILDSKYFTHSDIDWKLLFRKSFEQCIFPLVYSKIKSILASKEKEHYAVLYFKHIIDIKTTIKETSDIINKAKEVGLSPYIAKGFVLSKIIYDTPYIRQFGDVDIYIGEEQIVDMCNLVEQLDYVDELIGQLNNEIVHTADFSRYYLTRYEMKFVSGTKKCMIEVKSECNGIDRIMMEHFIKSPISVDIDGIHINSFDLMHTILYLFINTSTNFNTEYGIYVDYKLRDLTDVYSFMCKNPNFDYELLCEMAFLYGSERIVKYVISLVEKVFGSINDICNINAYLKDVVEADEIVKWESDFLFRMFNRKDRVLEITKIRIKTILENKSARGIYPLKIPQDCINVEECDFLCRFRLNPNLRLYNRDDKEMYTDFFINTNSLYVSFKYDINIRSDNVMFKIGFLNVGQLLSEAIPSNEINSSYMNVVIYSSKDGETSLNHSDIENVEIFSKAAGNINNMTVKIPITSSNLYITDGIKSKLLFYITVSSQGHENMLLSLYSWGGTLYPIMINIEPPTVRNN